MAAIDYLKERGLAARVAGKRLIVSPATLITEDVRRYIKAHRMELLAEVSANDGQTRRSHWRVRVGGKAVCTMICQPQTEQEALKAARWRWPSAEVE